MSDDHWLPGASGGAWRRVSRARVPGGGELLLLERDGEHVVRVDGRELMGTRAHASEDLLAALACEGLSARSSVRILVGGLGLGFTLSAALRRLRADAEIRVAEIVPELIEWNRGPAGAAAGWPLKDPRVRVHVGDVAHCLIDADHFDAILLDVDNGPGHLAREANAGLYSPGGLRSIAQALRPGGRIAIWAPEASEALDGSLRAAGLSAERVAAPARPQGEPQHVIHVGRRLGSRTGTSGAAKPGNREGGKGEGGG